MSRYSRGSRIALLLAILSVPALYGYWSNKAVANATPGKRGLNVLLIIVDDMGWSDTEIYTEQLTETPHLSRLAREGVRFTQYYAASSVCSPTRVSIMTGKYPARIGLTDVIGTSKGSVTPTLDELPVGEVVIGQAFSEAGYSTGYIGKWHLGSDVRKEGFDEGIAVNHSGQPFSYYYPYRPKQLGTWIRSKPARRTSVPLPAGNSDEYLTDRLTDEALGFMDRHREEPFFLVLSHYAVHIPLQAKPALVEKYRGKGAQHPERFLNPTYAAMVQSTDESVGRIMAHLDSTGLSENTILVFVSDNGGLDVKLRGMDQAPTTNAPLRAGKGSLYEGGIRTPLIIWGPRSFQGGRSVATAVISNDIYPTLLEMAGLPSRPEQHRDGVSLVPLLRGDSLPQRPLFWHFPHYEKRKSISPASAVRMGDYKLVEWLADGRVELFDLAADEGETHDLSDELPSRTANMRRVLHEWRAGVHAHMPERTLAGQNDRSAAD